MFFEMGCFKGVFVRAIMLPAQYYHLSKMSEGIYFNVLLLKLVGIFYGKVESL